MKQMSRFLLILLIVTASLWYFAGQRIQAQESRGSIQGRVLDTADALVPKAELRVTHVSKGISVEVVTNDDGNYRVPYLIPGVYSITARKAGFKSSLREGIEVRVDDTLTIDIVLEVGEVTQVINVNESTPLLETATASLGQVIDGRRLQELPIQSGNPYEMVLLAPGVVNATNLRSRKAAFNNAPSQILTDGNSQYSNEFAIDGVPNTFAAGTNPRVAFSPPQSAVAEVKVQSSSYDASVGHTPGSVINTTTMSGTNTFHGDAHWWLSNNAFDAPDLFFNKYKTDPNEKPPVYQDNRYGFSIGGPVHLPKVYDGRNKTFFFYTYDGNKWGVPGSTVETVPTLAERNGDFSQLLALGSDYQIYDPFSTKAVGDGTYRRTPVEGNIISPSRIDPVAKKIGQYWPQANTIGNNDGTSNFSLGYKSLEDYYVHLVRLDHNFTPNQRTFIRLNYDWWSEDKNNWWGRGNLSQGLLLNRINRGIAFDHVAVLSSATVLNFRYGLTSQDFPERRKSRGMDLSSLGFSSALTKLVDPKLATFPNIYFDYYNGFGDWESGDGTNTSMVHSFVTSLTTLRGNHNLHYGGEYRLYRKFQNRFPMDVSPSLYFTSQYTYGPYDYSSGGTVGQDLASYMFGLPSSYSEMDRSASSAEQDQFFSLYIQDDLKLSHRLTVNLGLRYEYETPVSERYDRSVKGFAYGVANPIQAAAQANYANNPIPEVPVDQFRVLGGLTFAGGANGHSLWNGQNHNFLPRIGLAFQVNPRTIIRTGYGIFYETIGVNRSASIQSGFSQATPVIPSADNGVTYLATFSNPFPNGLIAPLGAAGGLSTYLGQSISFYPKDRKQPYAQRWSFGLQRELPGGIVLEGSYVGNRGTRLQVARQINSTPASYLSTSPVRDQATISYLSQNFANPFFGLNPIYGQNISRAQLLTPYPQFGNISVTEPVGFSWYHALQVRAEKRMARGYTFQAAYTWSKLMEATSFLNPTDPIPYAGISGFDRTHRLSVSGIFELPFGKGRQFAAHVPAPVNAVIGGWQLDAVIQRQSGPPLGFGNAILKGDLRSIVLPKDKRSVDGWFNTEAAQSVFETSPSKQLGSNLRTTPLLFSYIRADGQARWDLSMIKAFSIVERMKMQFRAECFNALNHPNLDGPSTGVTSIGSGSFGKIYSQSPSPRSFQFALKLTY